MAWCRVSTFGSFHQFDLHHSVTGSFPSTDVEVHHGAGLLQGLHSSAVGHVSYVQLIHSENNVVNPETQKFCLQYRTVGVPSIDLSSSASSSGSPISPACT